MKLEDGTSIEFILEQKMGGDGGWARVYAQNDHSEEQFSDLSFDSKEDAISYIRKFATLHGFRPVPSSVRIIAVRSTYTEVEY